MIMHISYLTSICIDSYIIYRHCIPFLKLTYLKLDGWKTIRLPFCGPAFQGKSIVAVVLPLHPCKAFPLRWAVEPLTWIDGFFLLGGFSVKKRCKRMYNIYSEKNLYEEPYVYIYIFITWYLLARKNSTYFDELVHLFMFLWFSVLLFFSMKDILLFGIFFSVGLLGVAVKRRCNGVTWFGQIMYPPALQQNNMTMPLKMYFLLNMGMLHCHVSFRGRIYDEKWIITPFVWWIIWRYITFSI